MNKLVQNICNYLVVYFGVFILLILIKPYLLKFVSSRENFETLYLRGYPYNEKDSMSSQQLLNSKAELCEKPEDESTIPDSNGADMNNKGADMDNKDVVPESKETKSTYDPAKVTGNCSGNGSYAGINYKQDEMFIMANNKHSFSCCPSTYSTEKGCVCLTEQQKRDINHRTLKDRTEF